MDEAEIELKFEAVLIDADNWWDNLEQEERVEIYVKETKDTSPEQDVPNSQHNASQQESADSGSPLPSSVDTEQDAPSDEGQIKSEIDKDYNRPNLWLCGCGYYNSSRSNDCRQCKKPKCMKTVGGKEMNQTIGDMNRMTKEELTLLVKKLQERVKELEDMNKAFKPKFKNPEQDVPNSQDGNVTEPTSIKDVQTIEGRPDNTDEKQIKSDIPEREFMEGCLNQSLQLNQDMTLAIALYGLSKSWNIDKLIFLINECRKDKELENEKDK